MSARTIETAGISEAWLGACATLLAAPGHRTTHLVLRATAPLPEDERIRTGAEIVLAAGGHPGVDEVANTIFPAALAEDYPEPTELAAAYLEDYGVLKRLGSPHGTYFGRICAHPEPGGTPQLAATVAKLRGAHNGRRWRARYQLNIYAAEKDGEKLRGFPCMAHLGFQLAGDEEQPGRLDCLALYRNQDMIVRGYGNLLGLAALQEYLSRASGFQPGELTMIAGHADLTFKRGARKALQELLDANSA